MAYRLVRTLVYKRGVGIRETHLRGDVGNTAGVVRQPDHIPAKWPRPAKAGGHPELGLALAGRD